MKKMESTSYEVLDSHKRMLERQAWREENARQEREQIQARHAKRARDSVDDKVAAAVKKMRGMNAPATATLIESLSSRDRDFYLLAEEVGPNRKTILQRFPAVRKATRLAFYGGSQPEAGDKVASVQLVAAEAQSVESETALD